MSVSYRSLIGAHQRDAARWEKEEAQLRVQVGMVRDELTSLAAEEYTDQATVGELALRCQEVRIQAYI